MLYMWAKRHIYYFAGTSQENKKDKVLSTITMASKLSLQ